MLSKLLLIFIFFLVLLAAIMWIVSLVKPKVIIEEPEEPKPPVSPEVAFKDMTEQELIAARNELTFRRAALKNKEELATVRQQLNDVNKQLEKFNATIVPATPPSPTTPPASSL